MKIHYYPGVCVVKKYTRRQWWYCNNCGELNNMVVEDEFYIYDNDEPPYRINVRCLNCGCEISLNIDDLINLARLIERN